MILGSRCRFTGRPVKTFGLACDRWKAIAKHCNPNVVLLPIRLTQDDTQQDKGGRRSLKPMYVELANMRIQRRSELWTQICIGYVPAPNKNHRPENMAKEEWKRHKRLMFVQAMDAMLAPIRKYEEHGVRMVLPGRDRVLREVTVIPWMIMASYDQPEAAMVLGKLDVCACNYASSVCFSVQIAIVLLCNCVFCSFASLSMPPAAKASAASESRGLELLSPLVLERPSPN